MPHDYTTEVEARTEAASEAAYAAHIAARTDAIALVLAQRDKRRRANADREDETLP